MQDNLVHGRYVELDGETYYRIQNSQLMPEFFMSVVGSDDHWMFLSSRGALSAGRKNPDGAIFPYAADDQISAMRESTGGLTLIRPERSDGRAKMVWMPFSGDADACQQMERSLFKTPMGNKVIFEEHHPLTNLRFRYRWTFSPRFGFVRDCWLANESSSACGVSLVDGLQNILPPGVGSDFWMRYSNLGNAYKKNERVPETSMGLFYMSSIPTDRAEPSEGLRSTIVWHTGIKPDAILLSTEQVQQFRCGKPLRDEFSIRGKAGAFLVALSTEIGPGKTIWWRQVADVAMDQTDVVNLSTWLSSEEDPKRDVDSDIALGESRLKQLIGSSDGLQCGNNLNRVNRHFSNTLFNVMRGGVPLRNYDIESNDFRRHVATFNKDVALRHADIMSALPEHIGLGRLNEQLAQRGDPDLTRLGLEYLPLAFSRRHGDPTRPWNRFSIDLRSADGSSNLNYQGNWRDIFQNWEALAMAFPEFLPAMISRFVNATTADGYNAYRITKNGLEWEEPNPEDPWSNIGYWCDHQIIYLLKLLEWNSRFYPNSSRKWLSEPVFVHAEVPYRIRDYDRIKADPRDTIDFDWDLAERIELRVETKGSDGKLLRNQENQIHHVTMVEKILTLSLAKLSNFVPDGGVWLNTQRPEWNDANNALVGNGLSMVTTCYLHRWFAFQEQWIGADCSDSYEVSSGVAGFVDAINGIIERHENDLRDGFSAKARETMVDSLSRAGSDYRNALYTEGPSSSYRTVARTTLCSFFAGARHLMEGSIRSNKRSDGLYHSYNLLHWQDDGLGVETLYEMLEGQVAVLSSGLLSALEVVSLLDALRASALYRANQNSYLLYPDRQLPGFLQKNRLSEEQVASLPLLKSLLEDGNSSIVRRDDGGGYHFNGSFRNASDVKVALAELGEQYHSRVQEEGARIERLFEDVFDHRKFTGRSGTFFAYEGLGSIYWHMVSKLGLAVSENVTQAIDAGESDDIIQRMKDHLDAIRDGIGAEKAPMEYGAFPSDPYSHTPENAGVKQPGMTGQVKEDVIARYAELGVDIRDGRLSFRLDTFDRRECMAEPTTFAYHDIQGRAREIQIPTGGFGYTMCQVPVVYREGATDSVVLYGRDGSSRTVEGHILDADSSRELFGRTGSIDRIECLWQSL